MVHRGFYKIKNQFFVDYPDDNLKHNNDEDRPCYFCLTDSSTDLHWMVPMSKKVDKYKALMERKKVENKPCDFVHVARLDTGEEAVFIIGDMFPISQDYILGEYTINGNLLKVTSDSLASAIERKGKTIMSLIRKNIRFNPTQPDVLKIESELLKSLEDIEKPTNTNDKAINDSLDEIRGR